MDTGGPTGDADVLVGRSAELDDLDEMLTAVAAGGSAIVLLEGEAGVGTSALVAAATTSARLLGLDVRRAPSGPVATIAADLRGRSPVGALAPRLVVLEDLHRADDDTLAVLRSLAREGAGPGVLVLATMRPVPRPAALAAVVAAWTRAGARYLELRPLAPAAAVALAEQEVGAPVGPALRGWVATAGGNPRLVLDVVRAARGAHRLATDPDGVVDLTDGSWPGGLAGVVVGRIDYLGPEVVVLLGRAAVLGPSFVVGDLAALAGLPVAACWKVLRHALAAGVVHARGDRLVFRHDVVRTALHALLDPATRRTLHARAADLLAAAGAPARVVAAHRELADRRDDEADLRW